MRQMAHSCSDIIVFFISKYQWNSSERRNQFHKLCQTGNINLTTWCKNIVSIFDQHISGIFKTGFFRTGHRVSADEVVIQSKFLNRLMNLTFYTSHIRNDTVRAHMIFQPFKIRNVVMNRCAEENIIAGSKCLVFFRAFYINNSFRHGEIQRSFRSGICKNSGLWVKTFQRFGDGSADQPQTDKSYIQ